jgi:hypothetical protein
MMARSQVEAPVAMLRVYCSWPGVSEMMNLRFARREIAVGHVDGDALLALGLQAVHQQGQVQLLAGGAELLAVGLQRFQLIFIDLLGVVQQATDQGALAVVHAAAGEKAQQALVLLGVQVGFNALFADGGLNMVVHDAIP